MYKMIEPDQQQQDRYLEALEWLVSGSSNLGSGRTHLLARAFVNTAVKNPGRAVPIFDHHPTLRCTLEIMTSEVRLAAKRLYPLGMFTFMQRSIRFDGFRLFVKADEASHET